MIDLPRHLCNSMVLLRINKFLVGKARNNLHLKKKSPVQYLVFQVATGRAFWKSTATESLYELDLEI